LVEELLLIVKMMLAYSSVRKQGAALYAKYTTTATANAASRTAANAAT
jgi:hypothetical protein